MSTSLLFYSNLKPLDKNTHRNHKLKPLDNYSFTSDANSIPVGGFEFFEASRKFPIFFIKTKEGTFLPVALLSLKKNGHDLGDAWRDFYIPAYVRRYPFILSNDGMVLVDEDAPHFQEAEGDRLFDDQGETTEFTNDILKFLQQVDGGFQATEAYTAALAQKELLEPFKGEVKVNEGTLVLNDLYAINEKKMHEILDEKTVYEWFKKGWLGWNLAHLHSIGSIQEILIRARNAEEAAKKASQA